MPKLGYRHTDAAKHLIAAAKRGVPFTPQRKAAHRIKMIKATSTETYREKMAAVKIGKPQPLDGLNGASENNIHAKDWWLIKNQVHYRFRSLSKFVRDNTHLFDADELTEYKTESRGAKVYRATVMLRRLLLLKKDGTPAIPTHEWHGWTIGEKWAQGFYNKRNEEGDSYAQVVTC